MRAVKINKIGLSEVDPVDESAGVRKDAARVLPRTSGGRVLEFDSGH